jgi:toxin CcdB
MPQFDVYRNSNPATRARIPYLLDVQSDLLEPLATRIVVPLCKPDVLGGKPAEGLNPAFEVEGRKLLMLTPELAGVSRKTLGGRVANLAHERQSIVAALDLAFTGI